MTTGTIIVVAVGLAVLVGLFVLRLRAKAPWLGPLFVHELVRLARKGAQPRLRALYAGLLLVGLLVTYLRVFSDSDPASLLFDSSLQLPQDQRSTFTEWFTFVYLFVQLLAVSLITPVYAGGAIAEEKDRKSLDFLQSSLLTNREIVLGKLAARLTFVTCIVLVGMPVLFMTMLFGGLDENTIFAGFLLSFFTMLGLAGFSLLMGVYRKTLRDALLWPYGILVATTVFGFCCGCGIPGVSAVSPFSALTMIFANNAQGGAGGPFALGGLDFTVITLVVFSVLYGLTFLVCTALAVSGIRPAIIKPVFDPDTGRRAPPRPRAKVLASAKADGPPPVAKPVEVANDPYDFNPAPPPPRRPRTVRARRAFTVPPLRDGDPFLWKERFFSGRLPVLESGVAWGCAISVIVAFLSIISLVLVAGVLIQLLSEKWPGEVINWCLRMFVVGTVIGLAPVLGLRAAGAVAKERQQQTLLSLLGVPEARSRILRAKWVAPLFGCRYWFIALAAAIGLSLLTGGVHPLGAVAGVIYLGGFLPFANSFGLWLSVRCHTGTRAASWFIGVMLALVVAPPLFGTLFRATFQILSSSGDGGLAESFFDNVNPIVGLWRAFAGWDEVTGARYDPFSAHGTALPHLVSDSIIGLAYGVGALLLGYAAKAAFDRETGN
jgi:ABC-type transport system involved in multi-copper enzyme maturation permease subunit